MRSEPGRRLRAPQPIELYIAALLPAAVAAWLAFAHGVEPLRSSGAPWWAIAIGFALAEVCIVHVEFRRSAQTFSLADIPFVLGLVFASGDAFVAGAVLGTAATMVLHRRMAPLRLAFNVGQLALAASLAVGLFRVLAAGDDVLAPGVWLALYAAVLATGMLTTVLIAGAISLAEGPLRARDVARMVGNDAMVAVANTSVGIAAAMVLSVDARAAFLLVVPALAVFGAYRAYFTERRRHRRLTLLYEVNKQLARAPRVDDAITVLLRHARLALHSERAEVLLCDADGTTRRMVHDEERERTTMEPVDPALARELVALVEGDGPVVTLSAPMTGAVGEEFRRRGIREALVARLHGETRTVGVMLLANRLGIQGGYGAEDADLLEALANNASTALQYDRLERAMHDLRSAQQQLRRQAEHDPLTGLLNRAEFMSRLRGTHRRSTDPGAILFVDVDDFKAINDNYGHAAGDEVLATIAERMQRCVRPGDLLARMGGDEFVLAIAPGGDAAASARSVAERILRELALPVEAAGALIIVHVSIGIATGGPEKSLEALVREADVAMYDAKATGKGRLTLRTRFSAERS